MALAPIPLRTPIVDGVRGAINEFFRLRWEELRTLTGQVAAKGVYTATGQGASILSKQVITAFVAGSYRVTFTARRTTPDGAGSSLQFTWHGTDGGVPLSVAAAANAVDTTASIYSATQLLEIDANTDVTFDMVYASTTPGAMRFKVRVVVEFVQQV